MITILFFIFLFCLVISLALLAIIFKEFYYYSIYFIITTLCLFFLIFNDSLILLKIWNLGIEENLIIQDVSDIIWVMFYISFSYTFLCLIPYFFYLINSISWNILFKKEKMLIISSSFLIIYLEFIILYILFNDLYYSNFFDVSNLNLNFFELQLDLDTFISLIFSLFFDLNLSLILYQIFIFYCLLLSENFNWKNRKFLLFIISFFLFFYWFGGESLISDFLLFIIIFILNEFLYFLSLVILTLCRYKEI